MLQVETITKKMNYDTFTTVIPCSKV
uniref:Uncharacterized protein n=1 Tax=Anguilla anguilla TaxID=7936 RepID=A0A0E9QBK6_ANGAN